MTKIRKNFIDYFYILFIILLFIWLVLQFFDEIIYCDDGSISATNILFESRDNVSNNSYYDHTPGCSTYFYHYKHIAKRKLFYNVFVKGKQSITYNDFKQSWNPNINVSAEIKKEFISDIKLGIHKFGVYKNTLEWMVKPSSRGRWSRNGR